MGYVAENLTPGERVVHQSHLHWAVFTTPALLILLGVALVAACDALAVRYDWGVLIISFFWYGGELSPRVRKFGDVSS